MAYNAIFFKRVPDSEQLQKRQQKRSMIATVDCVKDVKIRNF